MCPPEVQLSLPDGFFIEEHGRSCGNARATPTASQGDENLSDTFHEVIEAYAQASTIQDHEVSSGAGKTLQIDLTEGALEGDAPID